MATLKENREQQRAGEGSTYGPENPPITQPAGAAGEHLRQGILRFLCLLREKDDLSAVGALRQVSECLQALVIRQAVLGKSTELVSVGMAGMEEVAHSVLFGNPASSENG
jgi:hypothetical protein